MVCVPLGRLLTLWVAGAILPAPAGSLCYWFNIDQVIGRVGIDFVFLQMVWQHFILGGLLQGIRTPPASGSVNLQSNLNLQPGVMLAKP